MSKSDSRYYKYYQPNDKDHKDQYGDCQIRALSKALGKTWVETFDLVYPICREKQIMDIFCCELNTTKEAMSELGFEYVGVTNKKGTKRPTVEEFAKNHKEGVYIAKVAHHVVAVVDGLFYDTWDSGYKPMYGYFKKVG